MLYYKKSIHNSNSFDDIAEKVLDKEKELLSLMPYSAPGNRLKNDVEIVFSDKILQMNPVKWSPNAVADKLDIIRKEANSRDCSDLNELLLRLTNLLREYKTNSDNKFERARQINDTVRKIQNSHSYENLANYLVSELAKIKGHTTFKAGVYKHGSKPKIELYYHVINYFNMNYEAVFAHELFHAYHYEMAEESLLNGDKKLSKIIKESLAAAFEYYYKVARLHDYNSADNMCEEWERNDMYSWPYAGAKYICDFNNTEDYSPFEMVFEASMGSVNDAFETLVLAKHNKL